MRTKARLEASIPRFVRCMIERLARKGHEVYVVGGAVRDAFMERAAQDWDLTTDAAADSILRLFPDVRAIRFKQDTLRLIADGVPYEITPFRGAGEDRSSLEKDLAHRDFTLNAMAYDPVNRALLDPHGGREDIRRKRVRAVGRPGERFAEDPLRLLRAVRFAAILGFSLEKTTLAAVFDSADRILEIPAERIRDELTAVLLAPVPSRGLRLMQRTGLMGHILPELMEGHLKRQNRYHRFTVLRHTLETVDLVEPTPVLRWTALLHDVAKPRVRRRVQGGWQFAGHARASADLARAIMERLRLESALILRVTCLIRNHMIGYRSEWSDGAVRRLIRRVGPDDIGRLIQFRRADILAHGRPELRGGLLEELEVRVRHILEEPSVLRTGDLALNGREVMQITGLPPGPEVGRVLFELLERVTDEPGMNTKDALEGLLREDQRKPKDGCHDRDDAKHENGDRGNPNT